MAFFSEAFLSFHSEQLSGYKAACEEHPALKSFDSSLQEQTNKVAADLSDKSKDKVVSPFAAYKVVSQHAVDVADSVAKFIIENHYNEQESKAIKELVQTYFESTKKTMDILNTVESCVNDAEIGHLYLQEAAIEFNNEKNAGGKKNKYEKTLKCVHNFKAVGDPFSGIELKNQFGLIIEQQKTLLKAASDTKEKLNHEIADLNNALLVANAVSVVAIAGLFIGAIALLATGVSAGLGVGLAAAGLAAAAGWGVAQVVINAKINILKKQLEALKKLDELADSVDKDIQLEKLGLETISPQVDKLEKQINLLLKYADSATEDEDDEKKTGLWLKAICDHVKALADDIKDVGGSADELIKHIGDARLRVLQKISS